MAKDLYAVAYKGKTYTRRTSRTYTHAVLIDDGNPGIFAWCGRLDLAEKQAAEYRRWKPDSKAEVVILRAVKECKERAEHDKRIGGAAYGEE